MLPRWLTALPRLANTYRDEMIIVALGLAYTAGVPGGFGARHERDARHARAARHHEVVVRGAGHSVEAAVAASVAEHAVIAVAPSMPMHAGHSVDVEVVAAAVQAARIDAKAARAGAVRARVVAPVLPTMPALPAARVAPVRIPRVVVRDAGENIAAALEIRVDEDTIVLPEVRTTLESMRATIDEARIRAAIQKALAAEHLVPRPGAGPGV
jgi:antitoxin component of MazEF toxin-antitoxin module